MSSRIKKTKMPVTELDKRIGARIRAARQMRNMSQTALGQAVNLTFQQIQKYEHGTNKVSINMGVEICRALQIDFIQLVADAGDITAPEPLQKHTIRLAAQYESLTKNQQHAVNALVKSMAATA